ncbi:hypothetical protein ACO3VM_02050 [Methanocaldococcus sp. 10A]
MWNIEPKEIKKAKSFKNMALYVLNEENNVDDEILLRTAINRYYYYVFLYLRERIVKIDNREELKKILYPDDNNDNKDENKPKIGPHTFLIIYLKHVINMSKRLSLGSHKMYLANIILSDLFNKRKLADYNLSEDIDKNILSDVEEGVKKLEECFDDLFTAISQLQGMNKLPKCDNYFE